MLEARSVLRNLSRHHVRETTAGLQDGNQTYVERLFDPLNHTVGYSSDALHFLAVGNQYQVTGALYAFRARSDRPGDAESRWLPPRALGVPTALAPWLEASVTELHVTCLDTDHLVVRLEAAGIEVQIDGGLPTAAYLAATDGDLDVTYDFSPQAPNLDAFLPLKAAEATWLSTNTTSTLLEGEARTLDGHLILHAVDGNGYSIWAIPLNGTLTHSLDGATVTYYDEGDGLWGPGDTLSWSGLAANVKVFDSWAGAFLTNP